MNYLFTILIFLALFMSGNAWALPDLQHPLTLSELVEIALENHPSTRQAWWNARRAAAALGRAKSAFYPQVGVEANVSHGRTFKFINGPDTYYTIIGADLVLSLLLYDFGERAAGVQSARHVLQAANWQSDRSFQGVMVRVLENAYALAHAQEVLDALLCSQRDAEKVVLSALELNRAGVKPVSDVYTTQAAFSEMKMQTRQQQAELEIQRGQLIASLGLIDLCQPIQLAPLAQLPSPPRQEIGALIELAASKRGDLLAGRENLAAAFSRVEQTKAAYRPKLLFQANGGANHAFHDKASALQYQTALRFEVPLFNGFETTYQTQIAYAEAQLSCQELQDLELSMALDILTYSKSLEAAQEMLPDAEESLRNSQLSYDSFLERYRAGKVGIAELSNALYQLSAARIRYSDVRTRWLVSLANLAYATGTLNPNREASCE